jgi:rubrerythrin
VIYSYQEQILITQRRFKMKKWKCSVCGEIVVSETRPEVCPLCKQPGEKFVEVVEDEKMGWAT